MNKDKHQQKNHRNPLVEFSPTEPRNQDVSTFHDDVTTLLWGLDSHVVGNVGDAWWFSWVQGGKLNNNYPIYQTVTLGWGLVGRCLVGKFSWGFLVLGFSLFQPQKAGWSLIFQFPRYLEPSSQLPIYQETRLLVKQIYGELEDEGGGIYRWNQLKKKLRNGALIQGFGELSHCHNICGSYICDDFSEEPKPNGPLHPRILINMSTIKKESSLPRENIRWYTIFWGVLWLFLGAKVLFGRVPTTSGKYVTSCRDM